MWVVLVGEVLSLATVAVHSISELGQGLEVEVGLFDKIVTVNFGHK
jgi:hypothetical protein